MCSSDLTTSGVQSMILSVCKNGDKIILPRNVHKSAINALVLCGAVPVYVDPRVDQKLGIPLGMELCDVEKAVEQNPEAAAVLVNNPTYYGICSDIGAIVDLAHAHGMKALALTDHGNLYGAIEFYNTAKAAGIKPILGMEAYISPGHRTEKTSRSIGDAASHLLLLAMNETGWRNLIKLSSRAFLEGFYYRPRLDRELLSQFNEGLICTSACLGGEIPEAFVRERADEARRIAGEYRDIFGPERFFIEIQNQGEADQDRVNPLLIGLAKEFGLGLVATNDVHFLRRADKPAHNVLTCISTGKRLDDPNALHYSEELYLKSPAEMDKALGMWPEAIANTTRIAEMCNLNLDFSKKHLPGFRTPADTTPEAYLRRLAWEGLARRFGEVEPPPEYRQRLEWELKVIEDKEIGRAHV